LSRKRTTQKLLHEVQSGVAFMKWYKGLCKSVQIGKKVDAQTNRTVTASFNLE